VESVLPHIQNQAISLDSAVVYVSVKNFEGWCFHFSARSTVTCTARTKGERGVFCWISADFFKSSYKYACLYRPKTGH
jgi:hypothetical protein